MKPTTSNPVTTNARPSLLFASPDTTTKFILPKTPVINDFDLEPLCSTDYVQAKAKSVYIKPSSDVSITVTSSISTFYLLPE